MNKTKARKLLLYLLRTAGLLLAVTAVSFTLVSMSPIDPVAAYVGADATVGLEQKERIAEYWGLNEPPVKRYFAWLSSLLKGDLGMSLIYRQPVLAVIGERAGASLALMGISWLISGIFGFILGIIAAVYKETWADRCIKGFCLALTSTPAFWLGLLLLTVFAVNLGLFPIALSVPIGKLAGDISLWERLYHMILPALTLSLAGIAPIALHTRQKLAEIMESDFILFAVARGEGKRQIVTRHGLRNIILPALTLQFASLAELFGGSVLTEQVFTYPGLGSAAVQAGIRNDLPLFLGITLFSAIFVVSGNTVADLLYRVVNPKIRGGEDA